MDDLEKLIGGWALGARMPDPVADRIRAAILDEPSRSASAAKIVLAPRLSPDWWRKLNRRTNLGVAGSSYGLDRRRRVGTGARKAA